jgi:hypothetical protein
MFFGFRECETRRNPKASWGADAFAPNIIIYSYIITNRNYSSML